MPTTTSFGAVVAETFVKSGSPGRADSRNRQEARHRRDGVASYRAALDDNGLGFEPDAEALKNAVLDTSREGPDLRAGRIAVVDQYQCMLIRNTCILFS